MKRQKIVIANWKMNLTVPESTILLEKFRKAINPSKTEVVVCPSLVDLYSADKVLSGGPVRIGAQNVFYEDAGAYTGEVSAHQIKGIVSYCIVGHSERRNHFGETDKVVAKKAAACVRHDVTPVICVGESLHEHMDGLTKLVVAGQTQASLADLTAKEVAGAVIAYEPVWAIGTGHADTAKKAAEVIKNIRNLVKVLHGEKTAESVRILYGGSVNPKNVKGFLGYDEIDGFLVGHASLSPDEFPKIVEEVEKTAGKPDVKKANRSRVVKKSKKK